MDDVLTTPAQLAAGERRLVYAVQCGVCHLDQAFWEIFEMYFRAGVPQNTAYSVAYVALDIP